MAPGQGTGFTSVGQYLDANQGTLANEASRISSGVKGDIAGAQSDINSLFASDPSGKPVTELPGYQDALGKAINAGKEAASLGSEGGLASYLQGKMGDSDTQSHFDAGLLQGNPQIQNLAQTPAGDLTSYLNGGPPVIAPGPGGHNTGPHSPPAPPNPYPFTPYPGPGRPPNGHGHTVPTNPAPYVPGRPPHPPAKGPPVLNPNKIPRGR